MKFQLCFLAVVSCLAAVEANTNKQEEILKLHCTVDNGTFSDFVYEHKLCDMRCSKHYRMLDNDVHKDGIVCSYELKYACRDGLCRQSESYPLNVTLVSNKLLDAAQVNDKANMYSTLCLTSAPTTVSVELPLLNRAHCHSCNVTQASASAEYRLTCPDMERWDLLPDTAVVLETYLKQLPAQGSDIFVAGEVFHLPLETEEGDRLTAFDISAKQDPTALFRSTWHIKWKEL